MRNSKIARCSKFRETSNLFFIFFFLSAVALQSQTYQKTYPAWFVTAPRGAVTAVGYAAKTFYPEDGVEIARKNAILNLARSLRTRITGEEGGLMAGGRHFYAGDTYREEPDSIILRALTQQVVFLDTAFTSNMTLVLVSRKAVPVDKSAMPLPENPTWLTRLPDDSRFVYSLGVSQKYFRELSSWLIGERNMRLQMALSAQIQIENLVKAMPPFYEEIQHSRVNYLLENCPVLARARKDGIFYILGRRPRNSPEIKSGK